MKKMIVTDKRIINLLEDIQRIPDKNKRDELMQKFDKIMEDAEYIGSTPANSGLN